LRETWDIGDDAIWKEPDDTEVAVDVVRASGGCVLLRTSLNRACRCKGKGLRDYLIFMDEEGRNIVLFGISYPTLLRTSFAIKSRSKTSFQDVEDGSRI
jgi:hypothetical protein